MLFHNNTKFKCIFRNNYSSMQCARNMSERLGPFKSLIPWVVEVQCFRCSAKVWLGAAELQPFIADNPAICTPTMQYIFLSHSRICAIVISKYSASYNRPYDLFLKPPQMETILRAKIRPGKEVIETCDLVTSNKFCMYVLEINFSMWNTTWTAK